MLVVPNKPEEVAGVEVVGFAPKSAEVVPAVPKRLPPAAGFWAPPKRELVEVAGCKEAVVEAGVVVACVVPGFAAWPKRELVPAGCEVPLPKRLAPAGFDASDGGAPAGVVEGIRNRGLAGVADVFAKRPPADGVREPLPEAEVVPKIEETAGAEEAGGVPAALNRAVLGCAGLLVFPKRPPPVLALAPPNNPDADGAEVLADVLLADVPKRGGLDVVLDALAPPKRPPGWPEPDPAAVVDEVPKLKVGGPEAALNRPPDAGAEVVAACELAALELGAPKLKDILVEAREGDRIVDEL